MHGVHLAAASTVLELRVRLYNRSDEAQTFLWWANVAAEVHSDYQSFFPADVQMVADHAKRAVSTFPVASGSYYGIDYPSRQADDTRTDSTLRVRGDRLDWPRNIPVPSPTWPSAPSVTSSAATTTAPRQDRALGRSPGRGGQEAVDLGGCTLRARLEPQPCRRRLGLHRTDGRRVHREPARLLHLAPGETKSFSQYWYPLAGTGPAAAATPEAALGVEVGEDLTTLRLDATTDLGSVSLLVCSAGEVVLDTAFELSPTHRAEFIVDTIAPLEVALTSGATVILSWSTGRATEAVELDAAVEPADPESIPSVEELYLTGRHLEQYRHATRSPEPYWAEALDRDPGHWASHVALAACRYRAARYAEAETHLRAAISRLTMLNPNPEAGDAHYLLGLVQVRLGRDPEAYAAFAKAAWLEAWVPAANLQMALIDARRGQDETALRAVRTVLAVSSQHLQARNVAVVLLRRLGRPEEADSMLAATLALDPLDLWARHLSGALNTAQGQREAQALLDVALESARAGEVAAAVELCDLAREADADRPLARPPAASWPTTLPLPSSTVPATKPGGRSAGAGEPRRPHLELRLTTGRGRCPRVGPCRQPRRPDRSALWGTGSTPMTGEPTPASCGAVRPCSIRETRWCGATSVSVPTTSITIRLPRSPPTSGRSNSHRTTPACSSRATSCGSAPAGRSPNGWDASMCTGTLSPAATTSASSTPTCSSVPAVLSTRWNSCAAATSSPGKAAKGRSSSVGNGPTSPLRSPRCSQATPQGLSRT